MQPPAVPAAVRAVRTARQAPVVWGLLLAGGEGRRMGGQDKGLLPWGGLPLVQHVAQRLRPQVARVCVSANRHTDVYKALVGDWVLVDASAWRGMGPLAALATLYQSCPSGEAPDCVQLAPCDAPLLPVDITATLLAALAQPELHAACPCADGRWQSTLALVRWQALGSVAAYLASGQRSVHGWLHMQHAVPVPFADAGAFANINDAAALQKTAQSALHPHPSKD